jgi:hypothetical protein
MSGAENCTVRVRSRHRRLMRELGHSDDVVDTLLVEPAAGETQGWATEVTLAPRWASVPAHVLEEIVAHDLGVADVSSQGCPGQLQVTVR